MITKRDGPPAHHRRATQVQSSTRTITNVSLQPAADTLWDIAVVDLDRYRADRRRFGPPSTFGLSPWELAAEIRRCRAEGWARWELRARFGRVA